jgi:hypothetical protein
VAQFLGKVRVVAGFESRHPDILAILELAAVVKSLRLEDANAIVPIRAHAVLSQPDTSVDKKTPPRMAG